MKHLFHVVPVVLAFTLCGCGSSTPDNPSGGGGTSGSVNHQTGGSSATGGGQAPTGSGGDGAAILTLDSVQFPISSMALHLLSGPDGNLWFTEDTGGAIGRITPDGVVTEFPLPVASRSPSSIAWGPDGELWFTAFDGIGKMTLDGVVTTEFELEGGPMVWGPDGNLWIGGAAAIKRITPEGTVTKFPFPAQRRQVVNDIIVGPDDNLWFTESAGDSVGRVTMDGVITEFPRKDPGSTGGQSGSSITAGPDGNLWFTEYNDLRVGRITPEGVMDEFEAEQTPSVFTSVMGIAPGPDGNLWFTEGSLGGIGRITPDGVFTNFSACSGTPSVIALGSDDNLWVTMLNYNGGFQASICRFEP